MKSQTVGLHVTFIHLTISHKKLTPWRQNPQVHHRIYKSPPSAPILSQLDPLYTSASLPKIHSNPIYALLFQVDPFLQAFSQKPCTSSSLFPCVLHAPPTLLYLI
jgi:hypothetical protein